MRLKVDELNRVATEIFNNCMPALHPRDITIKEGDRDAINFDGATVTQIVASIIEFYESCPDRPRDRVLDAGQNDRSLHY